MSLPKCFIALEKGEPRESSYYGYEADGHCHSGLLVVPKYMNTRPISPGGVRDLLETGWKAIGLRRSGLKDDWRGCVVTEHPQAPGEFFPRIWRSGWCPPMSRLTDGAFGNSVLATAALIQKLRHLFLTIEPDAATHGVYGHEIRSLLMLACTEVENAWAGVLRANSYTPAGPFMTRRDYVKLRAPMELHRYEINLPWYPDYPTFKPFETWNPQNGRDLPWYDAYNSTKHDRQGHFRDARLEHVIHALGALVVMLHAQFGRPRARSLINDVHPTWDEAAEALGGTFRVNLPSPGATLSLDDFLVPPVSNTSPAAWVAVNYPFP